MKPEDRGLWLLRNKVPPGYLLVAENEIDAIGRGLTEERRARNTLQIAMNGTIEALGNYWKTEPDLPNAAGAAVFDAARGTEMTDQARAAIDYAITALQTLANMTDGGCDEREVAMTIGPIINDAANKLGEALKFIDAKRAERRDRTKGTQ